MKYQILIKILIALLSNRTLTAGQIARRFEISRRTVYRYMDELTIAGIPVMVNRGKGGGFYIADSYRLPALYFTPSEFSTLTSVLNSVNKQFKSSQELSSIIEKLTAQMHGESVHLTAQNLIIDGTGWNRDDAFNEKLSFMMKAIERKTALAIRYVDQNGAASDRVVEPHLMALKKGVWYLYAYCRVREDFRLFKISRIEYANEQDVFERRPFDFYAKPMDEWASKERRTQIKLKIDASIRSDIEEWLGVDSIYRDGGDLFASAVLPNNVTLVREILKFGNNVKVIAPKTLADEIRKTAKSIAGLYSDK